MNRSDDIWATEIRFRILQLHFSNIYRFPYDLIKVGVYNFEECLNEYTSFDETELNLAWEETLTISQNINRIQI
jgi:hypothetical protein